jgi:hypothetical protein
MLHCCFVVAHRFARNLAQDGALTPLGSLATQRGNPMDAKRLREHAVHLLGMAVQVRDFDPDYADKLVAEAIELEERAKTAEEGSRCPKSPNRE